MTAFSEEDDAELPGARHEADTKDIGVHLANYGRKINLIQAVDISGPSFR
jgi:hypothetical protein